MSSADKSDESDPTNNDATGDEWCAPTLNKTISQEQLDLFVRKLGLSKADAVLAGSILREYGFSTLQQKRLFTRPSTRNLWIFSNKMALMICLLPRYRSTLVPGEKLTTFPYSYFKSVAARIYCTGCCTVRCVHGVRFHISPAHTLVSYIVNTQSVPWDRFHGKE